MIEVFKDSFILINYTSENKGSGMQLGGDIPTNKRLC